MLLCFVQAVIITRYNKIIIIWQEKRLLEVTDKSAQNAVLLILYHLVPVYEEGYFI